MLSQQPGCVVQIEAVIEPMLNGEAATVVPIIYLRDPNIRVEHPKFPDAGLSFFHFFFVIGAQYEATPVGLGVVENCECGERSMFVSEKLSVDGVVIAPDFQHPRAAVKGVKSLNSLLRALESEAFTV